MELKSKNEESLRNQKEREENLVIQNKQAIKAQEDVKIYSKENKTAITKTKQNQR